VAVRPILLYPHPLLSAPDNALLTADDPRLAALLRDMEDTLDASPGVALAAPQIGYPLRAVIVDVVRDRKPENRAGHGRLILLNPRILQASEPDRIREGCLSVPQYTGNVVRHRRIVVEGLSPEGRYRLIESAGYEAIAFQHEIDHLDGKLFLDRVRTPRRDLFPRKPL
jgi:peptide deformylase